MKPPSAFLSFGYTDSVTDGGTMLDGDKLDRSVVGSSVVVGRTDADLARFGEAIVFRPCGCSIRQSE